MGAPKLSTTADAHEDVEIPTYAAVVDMLRQENARRYRSNLGRAYTVRLPRQTPKPQPYATVELDYVGDFRNDKDPFSYALRVLGWE